MDWTTIGKQLAALGLPLLGTILGGPAGGAIGGTIANMLGVAPTPDAVGAALTQQADVSIARLKALETTLAAQVRAEADVAVAGTAAVSETMRAELTADPADHPGWFGVLQRGWRPCFAWELLGECTVMAFIMAHEVWTADFSTLTAMLQFQGFLTWYYGLRFGVIGVFSIGRSAEKVAAINSSGGITDNSPGVLGQILKALRGK